MNRVIAVIYGVAGLWFLLLASPRSLGEAAVKYAFAAILLFFAYRRFRASSKNAAELFPLRRPFSGFLPCSRSSWAQASWEVEWLTCGSWA